jgi:predicted dehydrogenase
MKALLIGCGRICIKHIIALKETGVVCSDLIDKDLSKLAKVEDLFGYSISKHSDLININPFNIVVIASDSDTHFDLSFFYLKKNQHLIIEKPVSLKLGDIDKISVLSNRYKLKVTVCHQNRFNPAVQRLRASILNKKLGSLFYGVATIRWNRDQSYYNQAEWRGKWRSDGGALMNQSIHNIDLLLWMMGSPVVEVFGFIDNKNHPSIEVEDMGVALLKFANGSFGIIESSMNTYPENFEETLSIFGKNGTVVLGGKSVNKIVHWNVKDDPIDDLEKFNEEVDSVYGNGHIALYKDFIEAIEQDREPAITLQDGRNAVEVILAIYLSSFEKRPVQLPLPADTSTIMFEGKSFK